MRFSNPSDGQSSSSVWELASIFKGTVKEDAMPDQAVVTFTYDEYIKIKRIVLDRDVQGALDFMKIIDKRCEHILTRQGNMKNAIDA